MINSCYSFVAVSAIRMRFQGMCASNIVFFPFPSLFFSLVGLRNYARATPLLKTVRNERRETIFKKWRERQTDRQTDRDSDRQTYRDREAETETEINRDLVQFSKKGRAVFYDFQPISFP